MPQLPAPRSRSELLHRARNEARLSLGERAFVRDARVLPFGVPLAVGLAALAYAVRRPDHHRLRRRGQRSAELAALGTAVGVLGATVAAAWLASRAEWTARKRAWDRERGW